MKEWKLNFLMDFLKWLSGHCGVSHNYGIGFKKGVIGNIWNSYSSFCFSFPEKVDWHGFIGQCCGNQFSILYYVHGHLPTWRMHFVWPMLVALSCIDARNISTQRERKTRHAFSEKFFCIHLSTSKRKKNQLFFKRKQITQTFFIVVRKMDFLISDLSMDSVMSLWLVLVALSCIKTSNISTQK